MFMTTFVDLQGCLIVPTQELEFIIDVLSDEMNTPNKVLLICQDNAN